MELKLIKTIHTLIYITMVFGIFCIIYSGMYKIYNTLFYISLGLLLIESIVFVGNGMHCPLTALAKKYGDPKGYVGDTFFPEKFTKYTFKFFGTLLVLGIIILILNFLGLR
jgi:hypothetical protein